MSDDRYIFGISADPLGDRPYAFVRVDAIVEERRLRTDFEPLEDFPTEGNVFVAEQFLPDTDTGAIWRVRRSPPRSGPRHAEWSAAGRGAPGPLEIISVPVSSSRVSAVRQQLLEGVDLGYVPASQVLVRVLDGLIVGPVKGNGYEEEGSYGFRSVTEAFAEPLRVWDPAHLDSFQVEAPYALDRRRRTFVCDLDLPAAQRFIDLADFGEAVKAILKPRTTGEGRGLTPAVLRDIAAALRTEDYPEATRERVTRVRRAVQSYSVTQEELDALMPMVLANAEVIQRIDSARKFAAEQEQRRVSEARQAVVDEIRRLSEQEQQLRDRVATLSLEAAAAEKSVVQAADLAVGTVRSRVQEAMTDVGKLLSDVALLRPFVTSTAPHTVDRDGQAPSLLVIPASGTEEIEDVAADDPETAADFTERLVGDLKAGGIGPNASRHLAQEIMAALLAGQMPIVTGSLAGLVARTLSRALAGRRAMSVDIPLGLLSDQALDAAVRDAARSPDDTQGVLVCLGIDRSAVELYAGSLRDAVSKRVLASDFEDSPLAFLATMCGGPASLPIGPGLFDFGPIVDTDLLSYSTKGGGRVPLRRPTSIRKWSEWRGQLASGGHKEIQESTRAACIALSSAGSMLWRKGAESAAGFMWALSSGSDAETSQAVLARWIVPRALAEGFDPDEIAIQLTKLGIEEQLIQGTDSPIAALLERARRIRKLGA